MSRASDLIHSFNELNIIPDRTNLFQISHSLINFTFHYRPEASTKQSKKEKVESNTTLDAFPNPPPISYKARLPSSLKDFFL